jgi:valyl-tRNA synthetase
VYLTGIVRDKQGRKMSKSLGNSPDPIALIEQYGADGVRVGMLLTSPAGNDLPFDDSLCEQGRNFSNKIWNALRLVKGWTVDSTLSQPPSSAISVEWFEAKLNQALTEIDGHLEKYRLSDALMRAYKLVWDDFCSAYLEMIKPAYQQPIDPITFNATIAVFEKLMKILHPFIPFITEEIWHLLNERTDEESIMITEMPVSEKYNPMILVQYEMAEQVIINLRGIRKEKNIPVRDAIELFIRKNNDEQADTTFDCVIAKLLNISSIKYTNEKIEGAVSFVVKSTEFFVPLTGVVDVESELLKLNEELNYTKGFLASVEKKLSNERFVNSAPEQVVNIERKKQSDAFSKITVLEAQIKSLTN